MIFLKERTVFVRTYKLINIIEILTFMLDDIY